MRQAFKKETKKSGLSEPEPSGSEAEEKLKTALLEQIICSHSINKFVIPNFF